MLRVAATMSVSSGVCISFSFEDNVWGRSSKFKRCYPQPPINYVSWGFRCGEGDSVSIPTLPLFMFIRTTLHRSQLFCFELSPLYFIWCSSSSSSFLKYVDLQMIILTYDYLIILSLSCPSKMGLSILLLTK